MEHAEVVRSPQLCSWSQAANLACCDGNSHLTDALPWGPLGTLQHKVLVDRKDGLTLWPDSQCNTWFFPCIFHCSLICLLRWFEDWSCVLGRRGVKSQRWWGSLGKVALDRALERILVSPHVSSYKQSHVCWCLPWYYLCRRELKFCTSHLCSPQPQLSCCPMSMCGTSQTSKLVASMWRSCSAVGGWGAWCCDPFTSVCPEVETHLACGLTRPCLSGQKVDKVATASPFHIPKSG